MPKPQNVSKHEDPVATVEPKSVKVKLPNPGTKEERFVITIKNPGPNRLIFKVRATKQTTFKVALSYGIVQSKETKTISVQPNKVAEYNKDMFTKADRFTILLAPIPSGHEAEQDAKVLWSLKPKPETIKTFAVNLEWVKTEPKKEKPKEEKPKEEKTKEEKPNEDEDTKTEEEDDDKPEKNPTDQQSEIDYTGGDYQKDPTFFEDLKGKDLLGGIKIEPKSVMAIVPCLGVDKEMVPIFVSNPTNDRLVFKLKCTQIVRFKLYPPMGLIDPKTKCKIEFRPQKFDETDDLGFVATDYLTVVLGKAPKLANITAKEVWKKGNPHEPKAPEEHKIPIQYAMMDDEEEEPQATPRTIRKTDKGFSYSNP